MAPHFSLYLYRFIGGMVGSQPRSKIPASKVTAAAKVIMISTVGVELEGIRPIKLQNSTKWNIVKIKGNRAVYLGPM